MSRRQSYGRSGSSTRNGWLLLALLAFASKPRPRKEQPWAPMGPFPEEESIPVVPIPPNPLDKSGKP